MVQFDWLIALGLVGCERLMMQFDWLIALGLVRCECSMVQFDWLIASLAPKGLEGKKERERERGRL